MSQWEMGKFTKSERKLLENQGLMYNKDVYPLILKAYAEHACDNEASAQLSGSCNIIRYLQETKQLEKFDRVKPKIIEAGDNEEEDEEDEEDEKEESQEGKEEHSDSKKSNVATEEVQESKEESQESKEEGQEGEEAQGDTVTATRMFSEKELKNKLTELKEIPKENIKHTNKRETGNGIEAAVASMQGMRPAQEDSHIVNIKLKNKDWYVSAIFDGHNGNTASSYLQENLIKELDEKIKPETEEESLKEILPSVFIEIDKELRNKSINSGSTAIVVIITANKTIIANLGDSRAIGIKDGVVIWFTEDHKPDSKEETSRIKEAGHYVKNKAVDGKLAVSRAFGDFTHGKLTWKKEGEPPEKQAVSVIPSVELKERGVVDHIILACDGVWDVVDNNDVAKWVESNKKLDVKQIADDLIDNALILKSGDNISAIIIKVSASEAPVASSVSAATPATPATAETPPASSPATAPPASSPAAATPATATPATAEAHPATAEAPPATAEAPPATADAPPATAEAPPATADAPPAATPATAATAEVEAAKATKPTRTKKPKKGGSRKKHREMGKNKTVKLRFIY